MKPRVLVIVVSYNGMEHIDRCLLPFDGKGHRVQIMVVDNASTDGTPSHIRERFPDVMLVESPRNLGFGAANNVGLRKAIAGGFDYAYLLNQDAWIEPDAIWRLVEIADKNPDFGIISPLQVYADGKKLDKAFSNTVGAELKNDLLLNPGEMKDVYEVPPNNLIQAAHWLIRREAIEKIGGFSPLFYHYGEDNDYCQRLFYHGYRKGIAPGVTGVHNREGRRVCTDSAGHLAIRWRHFLCNPNSGSGAALKRVARSVANEVFKYRWRIIKPLWTFMRSYRRCIAFREQAKCRGAFL